MYLIEKPICLNKSLTLEPLIRLLTLLLVIIYFYPSIAGAKSNYSLGVDVGVAESNVQRRVSGSSFSIVSGQGTTANITFGWLPSKNWNITLNTKLYNHLYAGPSAKTFEGETQSNTGFGLTAHYMGKAFVPYIGVMQKPVIVITDIATDNHEIEMGGLLAAAVGLKMFAVSKSFFTLELDARVEAPAGTVSISSEDVEAAPAFRTTVGVIIGKKKFKYGFHLGYVNETYTYGTQEYTSSEIFSSLFFNWVF